MLTTEHTSVATLEETKSNTGPAFSLHSVGNTLDETPRITCRERLRTTQKHNKKGMKYLVIHRQDITPVSTITDMFVFVVVVAPGDLVVSVMCGNIAGDRLKNLELVDVTAATAAKPTLLVPHCTGTYISFMF